MPNLTLDHVVKSYGKLRAVDDLSLEVRDGELLTLLGPSGCGKTTTLRAVSGFVALDSGRIFIGRRNITDIPPERRGIGLALVKLSGFEDRYPRQLSGGQQQRVALARALVLEPDILLLDEPLSNLDALLREQMRFEVAQIHRQAGITSIYVTHDQTEAMVISDRIAVMDRGKVVQIGRPAGIYSTPSTKFVAGFMGTILSGPADLREQGKVNTFEARVARASYVGELVDYQLDLKGSLLRAKGETANPLSEGTPIRIHIISQDIPP